MDAATKQLPFADSTHDWNKQQLLQLLLSCLQLMTRLCMHARTHPVSAGLALQRRSETRF